MKFLIFGTGEYYERYKGWFDKRDVVALLDNSPAKQNTMLDGIPVLPPSEGIKLPYDVIIVLSFYIRSMKKQLLELGVEEQKICHFYDLRRLIDVKRNRRDVLTYGIDKNELPDKGKKKTALLSTDLALGGTAIALFHMAETMKRNGYDIVFASMIDGPLRERLQSCGIPVVVDPNLQIATMREVGWVQGCRLIVCNAINYHIFLSERRTDIPMIWWLHDSSFFYDGVDKTVLNRIPMENLRVLSVGPVPAGVVRKYVPDMPVGQLLYGVRDTAMENGKDSGPVERENTEDRQKNSGNGKVCFVVIGHIEERKGQDILLQAVMHLEKEIRERAEFYLVGQNSSLMARRIMERAEGIPEITVTGTMDRAGISQILQRADMLVCPSREDPMPTVAAEAMMHGVPCLVSDVTGTAAYINRGENGDVFESGNVKELSDRIAWYTSHRENLRVMGERARAVYDSVFSMEAFEEKLMMEINGLLGVRK